MIWLRSLVCRPKPASRCPTPAASERFVGRGSKGKRGGVRVIYYFHSEVFPVFLLTLYAKNQKANLTKTERNELKQLAPLLVKAYERRRLP